MSSKKLETLDEFIGREYGMPGCEIRDEFEAGYEEFKIGHVLYEARTAMGLTQEEVAHRCGTNKGYISKIENNVKEVRLSTLKKIVEQGLSGKLEVQIRLPESPEELSVPH